MSKDDFIWIQILKKRASDDVWKKALSAMCVCECIGASKWKPKPKQCDNRYFCLLNHVSLCADFLVCHTAS